MMNFMREGGVPMWVMLMTFLGAAAAAVWNGRDRRPRILAGATVALLAQGLLGMSTGILMTTRAVARMDDPGRILALGLAESVNNGIFAGVLSLVLGFGWVLATREPDGDAAR